MNRKFDQPGSGKGFKIDNVEIGSYGLEEKEKDLNSIHLDKNVAMKLVAAYCHANNINKDRRFSKGDNDYVVPNKNSIIAWVMKEFYDIEPGE
ncbi:MAG: hypothetical protein A2418_03335 [Candidatus Brennerbacteria bacterium RIFOXYC1_FULL_41_11]|uniref:Uncharacterized protein n=1 Tax=Candidatus Brennerbacteria bacterium RIFOXYD1_FULL_41_16 TaxID=1797529 RepID=A0A1G1XL35_9BACT|nr:MAG: hypothetical protein A2391_01015 [Candidatus Brennerbacteria bacterium RIFOXYB1_FULL_41_13]OGY40109.1 MAG: hypothetical protein A2418_03335 [Candidatus Brennerbacteria bacterium RIFOXYC1_FULL_41_11]OGY40672.1 MAG: hypothetical protein A2570_00880 [Candidatus Brennerbacteria bacterium RIFOXYD1_FULL_41_16]